MFCSYWHKLCFALLWLIIPSPVCPYHVRNIRPDVGKLVSSQFGASGVDATYDYVVVGGGTAGLTIATRLAQNATLSVAVVEAGGFYQIDNGNDSMIPAYCFKSANATTLNGTNGLIDWLYTTSTQPQLNDQSFHFVRGKTFGGCSARNYLNYNRATVGALEKWAEEVGDDSYLWHNMIQYYQKSVEYQPPDYASRGENATNNDDIGAFPAGNGPLKVSYPAYFNPSATHFPAAFEQLGVKHLARGLNNGQLLGYASSTTTIDWTTGLRSSSASSFLDLALVHTLLMVYTRTLTERVIFDGSRASGIQVESGGQRFRIWAAKEVILSAGVVGSPQLLMLSGVGPKGALDEYNIPVVADRPGVGQNMHDNPMIGITYESEAEGISSIQAEQQFRDNGTGPLTNSGTDLMAFDKLSTKNFSSISGSTVAALASSYPVDWPEAEFMVGPPDAIFAALLTTFSRGTVTLASADVRDQPVIDPAWLTDPRDTELAVAAVRYVRELRSKVDLSLPVMGEETAPGPRVQSDADVSTWLKRAVYSIFHGSCTCKMGRRSDPRAVVDSDARVFGTRGLRVVDASAFPFLPPGQPQASVYALAEKIAARILAGH